MNHLDPDESPDWNDEIDAFEQQLRAIRPTAPTQSFSEIAESLEPVTERPAVASITTPATSTWRPILSHTATAAIGLAAGVVVMLMRHPIVPANSGTAGVSTPSTELADQQNSIETHHVASNQATPRDAGESSQGTAAPSEPNRRPHRFSSSDPNSGTLRAFGPINDQFAINRDWTHDWDWLTQPDIKPPSSLPADSDSNADSNDQPDDLPTDQPVLSPRSLHIFLNDLTYSPTSNQPVRTTEGFSS